MRHLDSRYGTNPAIVQGAIQKNTNDPNTAPTVLVTLLLPHHVSVFAERRGEADPLLVVTDGAPGLIAGADPRRNGDDYPMTSLSDGLGPQKDPNSGRTRVEGERRRRPIASGLRARGHRRIDAGDIDAGETWGT